MNENTLANLKYYSLMLYAPFVAIAHFTGLNQVAMESLSLLIIIDLITGVLKTIRLGKKPTSTRLANGVFSKLVLLFLPISVALAAKGLGAGFYMLVDTFLSILILSELYSITANIYTIGKKVEVEEFDVVSVLLRVIRKRINKILGDE